MVLTALLSDCPAVVELSIRYRHSLVVCVIYTNCTHLNILYVHVYNHYAQLYQGRNKCKKYGTGGNAILFR